MLRRLLPMLFILALTAAALVPVAAQAGSSKGQRLGGHVRQAWPATKAQRPKTAIARWLARQVGPRKPLACAKRPVRVRASCRRHSGATASAAAVTRMRAPAPRLSTGVRIPHTEPVDLEGEARRPLQLIRSFDIPADDPSYERLLNWSWTYDSAVAAAAFSSIDLRDQAGRLLDQLAALQRKDGSIEFAFDVRSGESSASVRAGSVAFAAIAFANYDSSFGDSRYIDNARRAADYLLSLRNEEGLVRGGPDVKWVSTQHNILTMIALSLLAGNLEKQGDEAGAAGYREAAATIAKAIDSQLLVRDDKLAHFRQGLGDDVVPLDTQALGIVYASFLNDEDLAKQLYEYAQQNFAIGDRSIELSGKPETYNMTYEAKGPFSGYRPYIGEGAPDVLWFEGTAEMRFVSGAVGQPTDELDKSMNAWWDVTRPQGLAPLGADRTVTGNPYNEYHVWPTAAAGAWTVLSGAAKDSDWANPKPSEQVVLELLR